MALAAVTASGCKADVTSEPETVSVIFEVNGTGGTLAAAADGDSIKSKGRVEKGKTAIFTAVPQSGYLPNAWTITGGKILAGGKQGDTSATVKLTSDITSIVSFKPIPPSLHTVTATHGAHGSLTALPAPVGGKAAKDSEMTFTATPDSGYKVDMWFVSGGEILSGGNDEEASVTVKISANTRVRVTFKAEEAASPATEYFTAAMTHGEHGRVSASPKIPADGKIAKDTEMTFSAKPETGYCVEKWTITGGTFIAGTGTDGSATAKVKIAADTTVRITFKKLPEGMYAAAMGHGEHGLIAAEPAIPANGVVAKDSDIAFTATPDSGYKVDMWFVSGGEILSGGNDEEASVTVKISANTTVRVTFKAASPAPAAEMVAVTMTHGDNGDLTAVPAPVDGKAAKDSEITFIASPKAGYAVDAWTVTPAAALQADGKAGDLLAKVKITAATTVHVTFKKAATAPAPAAEMVAVTMTHGDNGDLTAVPAPVDGKAAKDSEITFIASPKAGYAVDAWTVTPASALKADGKAGDLLAKVKITAATTVHVTFKKATVPAPAAEMVAVTMTHGDNGDLTAVPAPVDGKAAKDSEITFIASPKAGYAVDAWTVTPASALKADGKAGDLLAKVKITAATTVHVTFKKAAAPAAEMVAVTMTHGDNGNLTAAPALVDGKAAKDSEITFIASPKAGYAVDAWTVTPASALKADGKAGDLLAKVKITAATTVHVTFKKAATAPAPAAEMVAVTMTHGDNGNLTAAPAPVDGKAAKDSEITFIASPKAGYAVDAWTVTPASALKADGKAGDLLAKVKITAATTVHVTFKKAAAPAAEMVAVTMTHGDNGDLTAAPALVDGKAAKDSEITFIASPKAGYAVDAWTVTPAAALKADGKAGDLLAKVKITAATTVHVTFKKAATAPAPAAEMVAVTMTHGDNGNLTAAPAPVDGKAAKDSEITFIASPKAGYAVDAWTVTPASALKADGKAGDLLAKVKITAATTVHVTFKKAAAPAAEMVAVTMTHGDNGNLTAAPAPVDGKAAKDSEITFIASPKAGYAVDAWTVTPASALKADGKAGDLLAKVKITAATTVHVTFKKAAAPAAEMVAVTMTHGDNGDLTAAPPLVDGKAAKDSEITFIASPKAGYAVDAWTVTPASALKADGKAGDLLAKVKITAATTVHVTFKKAAAPAAEMVAVTMTHGDNGDLTAAPALVDGKAAKDSEITFIASPKAGYAVDAWTVTPASALKADGKAGDLLAKVKITAATTVHVTFKPIAYSVTFSAADAKGTLSATLDGESFTGGNVPFGKSVLFTAEPIYGYQADMWIIAGGEIQSGGQTGGTSAKIKITADTTVRVTFKPITYSVTFDAQGGSPVPQMQPIPYGGKVTEPAEPPVKANHVFKGWHDQNGDARWNFAADTVTNNTVLYAKWELNKYEVTFTVDGGNGRLNAALNGSPFTGGKVEHGQTIEFTAHPNDGYEIGAWTVSGGVFENNTGKEGDATATVKITAATTVTVKMNPIWIAVHFLSLDNYLQNTASDSRVNCIEVTELKPEHLKGEGRTYASPLGKILKKHPKKKVALKLSEEIHGDIDMTGCFANCTNLTQVLRLSGYITDMSGCFYECTNLTYVPPIPSIVNAMIQCFQGCEKLTSLVLECSYKNYQFDSAFDQCRGFKAKSIKVRSNSLQKFKDDASHMGAQADWFFSGN